VVDSILEARGLRRRIALILPSSAGVPSVVAATDLIATPPSRIIKDLSVVAGLRIVPAPLPLVEVSPNSPLRLAAGDNQGDRSESAAASAIAPGVVSQIVSRAAAISPSARRRWCNRCGWPTI
jgi:hypothetical protein